MFNTLAIMAATEAAAAAETAARTTGGQAEAVRATTEVRLLKHHIERILMITEALWDILKEQHGCSDEELRKRVEQIDMRDGKLDGRVAASGVRSCPHCKRPVSGRHVTYLWVFISEAVVGEGLVPSHGRPPATADLRQGPPLQGGIGDPLARVPDGRMPFPMKNVQNPLLCRRPVSGRHVMCLYCGHPISSDLFAR